MQKASAKIATMASDERKKSLLTQLGFVDPIPVDIDALADMFLSGKTNSISSHSKLLQRSPLFKDTDLGWSAEDGTPCPTCGNKPGYGEMTMDEARDWLICTKYAIEKETGLTYTEYCMHGKPVTDRYADDPVIVDEPIDPDSLI